MLRAFLLRYQETLLTAETAGTTCGTRTLTKVRAEQPDNDAVSNELSVFPREACSSGTRTQTRIPRESSDQDWTECKMKLFAKNCTRTKIISEHVDIPRGHECPQAKNTTAIKAEVDDNSPMHDRLQVIPECS